MSCSKIDKVGDVMKMDSEQLGGRLYWTSCTMEQWQFVIAATDEGLVYVDREMEPCQEFLRWAERTYPQSSLMRDDEWMRPYVTELREYWLGVRMEFSLPIVLHGTDFQRAVWNALRDITLGETRSYADIAEQIGRPKAVRAVGAAVGANPLMIVVPCHRVIGKDGALTGFSGGLDLKVRLLEIEGRSAKDGYVQYV